MAESCREALPSRISGGVVGCNDILRSVKAYENQIRGISDPMGPGSQLRSVAVIYVVRLN